MGALTSIDVEAFYPHNLVKRYGGILPAHERILQLLQKGDMQYEAGLMEFKAYMDALKGIPYDQVDDMNPFLNNGFFPLLDVVVLYGLLASRRPNRYIEVGSGNSTKIANYARRNEALDTEFVSIDPHPRAEIDGLCDQVIRAPLEDCDLSIFQELEAGDICFFDGSHRVLQNSDNLVFFYEVMPYLKPGVLVHIHDIFWPHDYPTEWANRFYTEQYVLGAMMLYGEVHFNILFPNAHISMYTRHWELFSEIWERPGYESIEKHGCSMWLEIKSLPGVQPEPPKKSLITRFSGRFFGR